MYSLAFVHDDVKTVVTRALETIPQGSRFHRTISAVIAPWAPATVGMSSIRS